ncbi:hypothetical protein [Candidatus Binatus sp.]|uniref:hypothetical protein n=1 Tax=Candidatus Binatus sp. TaxID=2811406 RepID=UPI003C56FD37
MEIQPDLFKKSKVVINLIICKRLFLDTDLSQILIFTKFASESFETLDLKSEQFSLRRQTMADELRRYCCRGTHNCANEAAQ